jgi:hypothetical protein
MPNKKSNKKQVSKALKKTLVLVNEDKLKAQNGLRGAALTYVRAVDEINRLAPYLVNNPTPANLKRFRLAQKVMTQSSLALNQCALAYAVTRLPKRQSKKSNV